LQQLIQTDEHSTLGDIDKSFKVPEDDHQIAAHIQLSDDGKFVLVSNRGRHNSISIFRITNPAEGKIERVSTISTQGHFPRFFSLIDDKYLLVANQVSIQIETHLIHVTAERYTSSFPL
jgi:6-phosphogluconolactonase (cycloisomerase 2 family)